MKEIWRWIPKYEKHYKVSNLGRVKSVERKVKAPRGKKRQLVEKIMSQQQDRNGYYSVWLRNGHHVRFFVHRLVAHAFLPNPGNDPMVNHKDRNKKNNELSNLEWCTAKENSAHWKTVSLPRDLQKEIIEEEEYNVIVRHAIRHF